MAHAGKKTRFLIGVVEARGHEVLGVAFSKGSHGKLRVRLKDGREVSVSFAWSQNKGEKIARHLMNMQLRALERGMVPDGRRDFDGDPT